MSEGVNLDGSFIPLFENHAVFAIASECDTAEYDQHLCVLAKRRPRIATGTDDYYCDWTLGILASLGWAAQM